MYIFDTQLAIHLLDENILHKSLKYLAENILHVPKEQIVKYDDVNKNDWSSFADYGMNDAIWTFQLYQKFAPEIEKQNLHHLFWEIEMPFQWALVELAINGMSVDVPLSEQMLSDVRHLYYSIEKELLDFCGGTWVLKYHKKSGEIECKPSINFNSSDQVIPIVESLGFEITERTEKGAKSFGKKTKQRLAGKHKFIDLLIRYGKAEKLISSFLEPFSSFVDSDSKIRSSFHNCVAVTGRLSSSEPNVEQLPKHNDLANIRNLYIADTGCVFVVADYKGQELRVLAEETQDPALKRAFAENIDIHQVTADKVGRSRDDAKTVNFGIIYGKEAYGFSKDFNISEEEAQKFIDGYFKQFPTVQHRIEKCRQQVARYGYVTNISGRKRRFPGFKQMNKWEQKRCFRQAFNFLIQAYSADMVKIAAAKVIQCTLLKIVNLVHDEIVVMCRKCDVDKVVPYVRECMTNAVKMSVPLEVEISVVERYGEVKGYAFLDNR